VASLTAPKTSPRSPSLPARSASRSSTERPGGRLAYYYPDFVVRLSGGDHVVVETKGLADVDVPHKDERASRWALDATAASGVRWSYLRVDRRSGRPIPHAA
jgi:hypothetical protein